MLEVITLTKGDLRLTANHNHDKGKWELEVCNTVSTERYEVDCTSEAVSSLVYLTLNNTITNLHVAAYHYKVMAGMLGNIPKELSPVP